MVSGGSVSDPLLPRAVSERVRLGELLLRVNKKSKGSHAWDQFCLVWEPVSNQEVCGISCCSMCKSCIRYKMSLNGEEKLLGTKNMLDHKKNCTQSSSSSVTSSSNGATSNSSTAVCLKSSWTVLLSAREGRLGSQ